jgi:hypothetical protein
MSKTKNEENPILPSAPPARSAPLDVNDPDWSTLFALKLDLMGRNHGCGPLEMLGRIMGCKRKAIRRARKIDKQNLKPTAKPVLPNAAGEPHPRKPRT